MTNPPDTTATGYLAAVPPAPPHPDMPQFDKTHRGYHIGQVNDFVTSLLHRIAALEHSLASAVGELPHDIALAAQSPQGQKAIDELLKLALDEITGQKAAATAQAAQVVADARAEADKLVAAASEQVTTIVEGARSQAKQLTDNAAARAAAVSEGADQRLQALMDQHAETISRLGQINQVTGQLLTLEKNRGNLREEVERVMPATAAVAASARPELTAVPADKAG